MTTLTRVALVLAVLAALVPCVTVAAPAARQAKLSLSAEAYERTAPVEGELRLPEPITAKDATISYEVTDSFGRVLMRKSDPVEAADDSTASIRFSLPVPNIVVMRHYLGVTVQDAKGQVYFSQAPFVFKPRRSWDDYEVHIYQKHPPQRLDFIREAYVTNNLWYGSNPSVPEYMVDANFRWYVENTAIPVLAPYHRWYADGRPVGWLFDKARERFRANRDLINLQRTPCLSQEPTLELLERCVHFAAHRMAAYRPVWYSLSDETGIGNQASESGFCFSPECRETFREWLKKRYASLEALNAEWGTEYAKWEDVRGATPDEIFARKVDNFGPWCDHTEFMDDRLFNAYMVGRKKIEEFDPGAFVGIGGGQGPVATGGWDWYKLSHVLTCSEPYYIGSNWELIRSFNPNHRVISITGGGDNNSKHMRWFGFIHGDAGSLMWDDKTTFVDDQGKYDQQGTESAKWHKELTGGLARQYMAARWTQDPIAVYESQASMRVHWVLHVRPKGQAWANRGSRDERVDNPVSRVREAWLRLIEDAGLQYTMLAPQMVLDGRLKVFDPKTAEGFKLLILPRIIALSTGEVDAIRKFVEAGGTVIADGLPGLFTEHGRRLPAGQLDELFGVERPADQAISMFGKQPSGLKGFNLLEPELKVTTGKSAHAAAPKALISREAGKGRTLYMNLDIIDYHRWRLHPGEETATREMMNPYFYEAVAADRYTPTFVAADGKVPTGVEITVKDAGDVRIVALNRNPQTMIGELGPMEYQSNEGFEKPVEIELNANRPGQENTFTYVDMRTGKTLGEGKTVKLIVVPFEPTILSVWPKAPGEFAFAAPTTVRRGDPLNIGVRPGSAQARQYVYNIEVTGPDGKQRMLYRQNFTFSPEGGQIPVPLALNDAPGTWKIAIREALTGTTKTVSVQVE